MYIDHTLEPQGYVLRFQFLIQDYSAVDAAEVGRAR